MTLLRTIGSPIIDVDLPVYLNTHAKHPINEKLEAKIRAKRIEMGLESPQAWETYGTYYHDNRIYYAADNAVWEFNDPPAELETRPIG